MIDWDRLVAPSPPPRNELLPATAVAAAGAALVLLAPVGPAGPWSASAAAVAAIVLAAIGALAGARAGALRPVCHFLCVLLVWQTSLAAGPGLLPDAWRALSPQTVVTAGDGLRLSGARALLLLPAVLACVLLCRLDAAAWTTMRSHARIGSWTAGIRWPLPWWGVPAMPIWMFVAIGLPCAVPAFVPMIDFAATGERWGSMSGGGIAMVFVIALVNATLEESVFRLGLVAVLARRLRPESAVLPAAIAFGCVHFHGGFPDGPAGATMLAIGSYVFGYLMIAQRGLSAAVLWHAAFDVLVLATVFRR